MPFDPLGSLLKEDKHENKKKSKLKEEYYEVPSDKKMLEQFRLDKKNKIEPKLDYIESPFGGIAIKRIEHKNNQENQFPLPQNTTLIAGWICGAAGSGKSTVVALQIAPKFNVGTIIVFTLIEGNEVFQLLKQHCKKRKIRYYEKNELDDDAEDYIKDIIGKNPENANPYTLIIFDDFNQSGITDRNNEFQKLKNQVFSKYRNKKCYYFEITQNMTMLSTMLANNTNFFILYQIYDQYGYWKARTFITNQMKINNKQFDAWYSHIDDRGREHSFIMGSQKKAYWFDEFNDKLIEYKFDDKDDEKHEENDSTSMIEPYIDKFKSGRFADKDVNEFKELVLKIAKEYKTSAEDVIDQINQKYDIELF
jgi:hypothetical protein